MPASRSMLSQLTAPAALLLAVVAVVIFFGSAYQIDETEQVVITRFGKPVGEPINAELDENEAGLHFKIPLISTVNRFDTRVLEWDGQPNQMTTRDKLYIVVDTFARWRIADPLLYFQALRDERSALSRLDDIIGSETRNVVARHDLIEVVRSEKDRKPVRDETLEEFGTTVGVLPPIRFGRISLEDEILQAAIPKVTLWGIELLDVRIKRINYKSDVITKIYERMISEREQIAERFRSEGAGAAAKIDGRREKDLLEIKSQAYREVEEIQGKADATASKIYADAYNTSPAAAEFYGFVKTLDMYREALSNDTTVILTTDSDLFRLLKSATPKTESMQSPTP
ncbi:MAG: protease modulator HflC [Planctomycetota bacterium]|nr:protease modulator HflC [Planctomycetota bacterium]